MHCPGLHLEVNLFVKYNLLHIFTKGAFVGTGFLVDVVVDVDVVLNFPSVEVTP